MVNINLYFIFANAESQQHIMKLRKGLYNTPLVRKYDRNSSSDHLFFEFSIFYLFVELDLMCKKLEDKITGISNIHSKPSS